MSADHLRLGIGAQSPELFGEAVGAALFLVGAGFFLVGAALL
jgi:hypothetical protein